MAAPTLRLVKGAPLTNAEVDANFNDLYNEKLALAGGTMSGALSLAGDPVASLHAATKQYVDNNFLAKAGGTLTGALTLAGAPTSSLHAATKSYVDTQTALNLLKSGGLMTGALTLSGDPTTALMAATKQYVDTRDNLNLSLAGGTLSGALVLAADPTANMQAATKQYVDNRDNLRLALTGGTLSGALTLAGAPSSALHAATKAYVDGTVTSLIGTVNQIGVSSATGAVTLTLPQNINAGAFIQFASMGIGTPASGVAGEIRATNEVTAYYSSDASLKENVAEIPAALAKLAMIRGVSFDWKDEVIAKRGGVDGYFVRKHDVGVIAQEVLAVLPEVVAEREDKTLAVKYEKMVPLLIQAVNELAHQVVTLERKVSLATTRYA
jgi:hypothetical protein